MLPAEGSVLGKPGGGAVGRGPSVPSFAVGGAEVAQGGLGGRLAV